MTKIIDTSTPVTGHLDRLKAAGVECVARYISVPPVRPGKCVTPDEAHAIAAAGLKLLLIYEHHGGAHDLPGDINATTGKRDGLFARNYAPLVGAPPGAAIIFAIDTDVTPHQIHGFVLPYLEAADEALGSSYRMGVYGNGAVCEAAQAAGLVNFTMLAQSKGWARYHEYLASGKATIVQGMETHIAGLSVDPNTASVADFGQFTPFATAAKPKPKPLPPPPKPDHHMGWTVALVIALILIAGVATVFWWLPLAHKLYGH